VGKANVSREALVAAIASLEAQRRLAGDDQTLVRAMDTALQALREELQGEPTNHGDGQHTQLSVLVADLAGFTALSERMDVENVRNAINAMWGVLDEVIHSWGGRIDQHAGDGLTALFGLPRSRDGDAGRALHAALAMQRELALFNERVRWEGSHSPGALWAVDWPGPSMRIGVHSGPVYFARALGNGRSMTTNRLTAVGDTVATARRLERLAPDREVLASESVFHQTHHQFIMRELAEEEQSELEPEPIYLVVEEKIEAGTFTPEFVAGQATRLVGRSDQMDQLEMTLQSIIESRTVQLVTITGPSGVGKSRLVDEFEGRIRFLVGDFTVLHAEARGQESTAPFGLVKDLLLRHLNIRPQDSPYLVEDKLRRGLAALDPFAIPFEGIDAGFTGRALALLEQLLEVSKAGAFSVNEVMAIVEPLLRAVSNVGPALVVLEGVDQADPQSIDLVDRLVRGGIDVPILFLAVATEAEPAKIPWLNDDNDLFSPFSRCDVPVLSAVESRLMATQILSPLSPPPIRLLDLIVAESTGNPLYIESFIRLLMEQKAIITDERWRVDMSLIETFRIPVGLRQLIAAHLAYLSDIERNVLERAAVIGPYCWDVALLEMEQRPEIDKTSLEAALLSLEAKHFLKRVAIYSFAATQAYAFHRESVRQVAYEWVAPDERRALHLAAAYWFVANREPPHFHEWLPVDSMIAYHFAQAGDEIQAAVWRQRTGGLAK
jgi:class 3 adenylate cyclase